MQSTSGQQTSHSSQVKHLSPETVFVIQALYCTPVVSIISSGQKSACCCQQFYFLFVTIRVWCSTGLTPVQCLLYTTPFQTPYSVTRSTISFLLTKISFKINYQMTYKALQATPPNDVQSLTSDTTK